MSKLLSLKEWVTLDEAADYLSGVFREAVSVADLYRFALASRLTLSANFVNHGRANMGQRLRIRDAGFKVLPSLLQVEKAVRLTLTEAAMPEFEAWLAASEDHKALLSAPEPMDKFVSLRGEQISATECVQLEESVTTIDGVWDLTMIGGERIDVEHALQGEVGGPSVELFSLGGVILRKPDGRYARLLESFGDSDRPYSDPRNWFPTGGLPSDAPLVIRPQAMMEFVASIEGENTGSNALDERVRATLLCIIGGLASNANLDLSQPYKAGEAVAAMLPGDVRLSARTIGDHLKAVREALDSRKA